MASLYDLELQESNNFIHALIAEGVTPALKLFADMVKTDPDPNSDLNKNFQKLQGMAQAIKEVMLKVGMTPDLAKTANDIFSKSPESMANLSEDDKKVINDYWLKKKTIIVVLLQKGYTHEELFS